MQAAGTEDASGTDIEQQKSVAHWDKCFYELCTGQRGVSGWAIAQIISYTALLCDSVNKVWFLSY